MALKPTGRPRGRPRKIQAPTDSPLNQSDDEGNDESEQTEGGPEETTAASSGEWTIEQTGADALETLAHYAFLTPWLHNEAKPRAETLAVMISEREGGSLKGKEVMIFSHNVRTHGADIARAFDAFLENNLPMDPEPLRMIWIIQRNPQAELRYFDSRSTFYLVNAAYREQASSNLPQYRRNAAGLAGVQGLPVNLLTGASPLGISPMQVQMPLERAPGIVGDIGGTGLAEVIRAMTEREERQAITIQKMFLFYADLMARQHQATAAVIMRSPDRELEIQKMYLDLEKTRLEADNTQAIARNAETSGVIREISGKILDNPALTGLVTGIARKLGVDPSELLSGGE